jgi:anti-sigma B factor antagonist
VADSAPESVLRPAVAAPVVQFPGEIDIANREQVRTLLLTAVSVSRTVIVDMSGTAFCDSSGISVLVSAAKQARASGGDVLVVLSEPASRRIFKVTGVDRFLRIFETVADAVTAAGTG